jgi:hypothetical protein
VFKFIALDKKPEKQVLEFATYKEAVKEFFDYVKSKKGILTYQVLETAYWVEDKEGRVYFFYEVRDMAILHNWVENKTGEWIG